MLLFRSQEVVDNCCNVGTLCWVSNSIELNGTGFFINIEFEAGPERNSSSDKFCSLKNFLIAVPPVFGICIQTKLFFKSNDIMFNWSGRRDLNSRHPRWQRGALPLSYSRKMAGATGLEPITSWLTARRSAN